MHIQVWKKEREGEKVGESQRELSNYQNWTAIKQKASRSRGVLAES